MSKYTMNTEGGNVITDRAYALAKQISERLIYFHGFWIKQNKATIVAQSKQRVKEIIHYNSDVVVSGICCTFPPKNGCDEDRHYRGWMATQMGIPGSATV